MPVLNTEILLTQLGYNSKLISLLFGKKDSVSKSEILSNNEIHISEDSLDKLANYSFIHENTGAVSLDMRIVSFLEDFLEIGEVNTGFITDSIQSLSDNISFYQQFHKEKSLREIKKYLKKITLTTSIEVQKLHKAIDDTYKNEPHYEIKLQKLQHYRKKRDDIIELIGQTEEIYQEYVNLFIQIPDIELTNILNDLRKSLRNNRDYLIGIQNQITEYIHQMQQRTELHKKIQRIKELKDYGELKHKSNYIEIAETENPLLFQGKCSIRSKIPIHYFYTDEGVALAYRVAKKLKLQSLNQSNNKKALDANFDAQQAEKGFTLNLESVIEKFNTSQNDLFQFLLHFDFGEDIKLDMTQRISLYMEISLEFGSVLEITDKFDFLQFVNDKQQNQTIGYALIYAKKTINTTSKNDRKVAKTNR